MPPYELRRIRTTHETIFTSPTPFVIVSRINDKPFLFSVNLQFLILYILTSSMIVMSVV